MLVHPRGKKKVWNGGGKSNVYEEPVVQNRWGARGFRVHETQKPEQLMSRLVADFTQPGSTILDMCAGSGTTLVAAKALGRRAIGISDRPKDIDATIKRLRQEVLPFCDSDSRDTEATA